MKLVCIDTHLLIWGVQKKTDVGQELKINRTLDFFELCKSNDTRIMIPAIVVAEFITGINQSSHNLIVNALSGGFNIIPFDAPAAVKFAQLWKENSESGLVEQIKKDEKATRNELKADCMIVASAISRSAEVIFSHDVKLKRFAEGKIDVKEIPVLQTQQCMKFE